MASRTKLGIVAVAAASTVTAVGIGTASAAHAPTIKSIASHHVIAYHPMSHVARPAIGSDLSGGLRTFTGAINDGGTTFHYTMVGKNPKTQLTNPTSQIATDLIPVRVVLPNNDFTDPTTTSACDTTASPVTRVLNSPVVKTPSWTFGGTSIGKTQYVNAFRRAEFWKFTKPTGINPGYAVNLKFTQLPTLTIDVPLADAAEGNTSCGPLAAMEINWLDGYLQNTVLPSLHSQGLVAPNNFPLFLTTNTVEYETTTSNCCILGYHNAYTTADGVQTYGIAEYDNGGDFAGVDDVSVLTHEIAEWMDDPLGNNPTQPWGHIGQVSGCQNNLEVGDPLSGTEITKNDSGYQYHMQELAFFSWFFHQSPSTGVKGWYSDNGTFRSAALPCS